MKTKVCFKALSNRKIVRKIIPIEHNFEVIPEENFNGILPKQSIESQVIDYLDNIDKTEIMLKYNFEIIFDYYIPKRKQKKDEIQEFIEYLNNYISVENNRSVRAILSESKDILFGKGKSNETKAKELFTILNVSYKSIIGTLNVIDDIIQNNENKENMILVKIGD